MWGYLSDESIDGLDNATLEFHHKGSECPGGDRCEYTAKEGMAHVRRLRKRAKRPRTLMVHTCSDAVASHRDRLCTVPRIHEQVSSTMVAMDNHYKMSLCVCMFAALSCLLGKREARQRMPKNSAWNPSILPTHSPGALDESWGQVAHYLDEIHPSPSKPTASDRRPSPPMLPPPRDTEIPAPEDIPFLALRALSSKPAPDEESECALSDEGISEDSDSAQRASLTGLQDWSSHRPVQVLSVPTFSGGESPPSDLQADSQISNGTNDPILQHAKKRKMRKTKGEKAAGKSPTSEHSGHTRLAYRSTLEGGDKRNSHKHHQRQRPKRRAWWEVRQEAIANGPPRTPCSTRRAHTLGDKEEAYSVVPQLREWMLQWANRTAQDTEAKKPAPFLPTIDAFASGANRQFRRYWSKTDNALRQDWSEEDCLWLNPPFSLYPQVVEKIFLQGARGIAIVPKWERQDSYWALGQAAVDWVDLPHDIPVFQDDSGTVCPQRGWDTCVVLFDACFAAHDDPHHVFETPNKTITNEGKSCVPPASGVSEGETADTEDSPGLPRRRRCILHRLSSSDDAQRMWTTGVLAHHSRGRLIRSVVGSEAEHEHPQAPEYKRKLVELFPQVFESKTYKDIMDNYLKRGKYGVCKIEEIPGAVPREFGAIRAVGHRYQALPDKIDEVIRKGFIEAVTDAGSGWCSRAFLVPKPNGKWRLVIDYRYVNTQIKNYKFTLPVIEDQLINQSRNHLWTIVDLEDGFHQMPLHEDSKNYTTFSTPFGNFQWNVLLMGIKIAPQAFQRMVADCLQRENDTDFEPYVDDILNGTPAVDGEICQDTLDLYWERV